MKTIFQYGICAAAWLATTACSDEWSVQAPTIDAGETQQVVRVAASLAPRTRMEVADCGSLFTYSWSADDAFTVFDALHGQQTLFNIEADSLSANGTSALFQGMPDQPYESGQTLIAVYNAQGGNTQPLSLDANGNLPLDLTGQNGTLRDDFQFLYGEATFEAGKQPGFFFSHLVTTLRLQIEVPEGVTEVHHVRLRSANLVPKATLVLNKAANDAENMFSIGDLVYSYSESGDAPGELNIDGSFIPTDGKVSLYAYVLDAKLYNDNKTYYNAGFSPTILMEDQSGQELVSVNLFPTRTDTKGGVYEVSLNRWIPLVDFENEVIVEGGLTDPYEIANADQLYSLMMRSKLNLKNPQGISYSDCSYRLIEDIRLERELTWNPINMNTSYYRPCMLDGNGKTISGILSLGNTFSMAHAGFLGEIYDTTVRNLTLDLKFTVDNISSCQHVGALAGYAIRCQIDNCMNRSHMSLTGYSFPRIGGLLGYCNRTDLHYCGFQGSMNLAGRTSNCGGLVGYYASSSGSSVIACYSAGKIAFSSDVNDSRTLYLGGIIGYSAANNSRISYCWSRTSVQKPEDSSWSTGSMIGYQRYSNITLDHCYWQSTEASPLAICGNAEILPPLSDCASFEGDMPTEKQLGLLNQGIVSGGYVFSSVDGFLTPASGTIVPPSDIEEW